MSEKRKWFDARRLPDVEPLKIASVMTREGLEEFQTLLSRSWMPPDVVKFFSSLIDLAPEHRLARNFKVLISEFANGTDSLLSEQERGLLGRLERADLTTTQKEAAYSLLNTYERYQLQRTLLPLFRHAKGYGDGSVGEKQGEED